MLRSTAALAWSTCALLSLFACACGGEAAPPKPALRFVVVTFNTGTTSGLPHDRPPDDGYTSIEAIYSDLHYGDGLAWRPAVEATERFFAEVQPDLAVFQEIFYAEDCATVPDEARAGFVCETWMPGGPTVVQVVVGMGYQVACNLGKPDKCAAVKRTFGALRGCDRDLCLDGLAGARVDGCGGGSRIGRGVVDLAAGGSITVVDVHGSSGLTTDDASCRVRQFDQVFFDLGLGDGRAANGAVNVVMGDFNTDPVRFADSDASAARVLEYVGDGKPFHFVTAVGPRVPATYAGLFNIDHVISDAYTGSCWHAGVTAGHPNVIDAVYFDHKPAVCTLEGDLPP